MTAYVCDRCGKYFQSTIKRLPLYMTKNPSYYRCHELDLCPKCQKALEEWWEEGEREKVANNGDVWLNKRNGEVEEWQEKA